MGHEKLPSGIPQPTGTGLQTPRRRQGSFHRRRRGYGFRCSLLHATGVRPHATRSPGPHMEACKIIMCKRTALAHPKCGMLLKFPALVILDCGTPVRPRFVGSRKPNDGAVLSSQDMKSQFLRRTYNRERRRRRFLRLPIVAHQIVACRIEQSVSGA